MKKIVLVGPESTGKSTLTKELAAHFEAPYVTEYARKYIEYLDRDYTQEDILKIAKKQYQLEKKISTSNSYLFLDTDLLVCKVWSEYKYQNCDDWILSRIENEIDRHYLLCDIDLNWEYDPQREHPINRKEIFEIYKRELSELNLSFQIVSGCKHERINNALAIIKNF